MLNFFAVLVTLLASAIPGPQDGNNQYANLYASEAPYGNAATSEIEQPPEGYSLFFIETIGRHGSRAAVGYDEEKRALKVWEKAKEAGALTETGEGLKDDIERFQAAEKEIGYGELSSLGKSELTGIGRRTAENYAEFFSRVQDEGDEIAFVTSPVKRTKESADTMKGAITERYPDLDVAKDTVSKRTLVIAGNPSATGDQHIDQLRKLPDVKIAANNVLANLYQPQYIASLKNPVGKALDLYKMYQRGPGLVAETDVTFSEYVDPADAEILGHEQTGEKFYRYGAGIRGEDNSYRGAKPLLKDFMKRLEERVDGGKTAAVFRHAHGETLMPFTALTQLRSANEQESTGGLYGDESNPFRGYKSGAIGGSIEWAAYRNEAGKVLLTLRFNEKPSRFSKACKPTEPDGKFYTLDEIRSCIDSPGGFA